MQALHFDVIPIADAFALAGTGEAVWAGTTNGVVRIDVATRDTSLTELPGGARQVSHLAATDDAVWAADYGAYKLHRIDAATSAVAATVELGTAPKQVYMTGRDLYVVQTAGTSVMDPGTMAERRTIDYTGVPAFGALWVVDGTRVLRVNLDTGEVEATIAVPGPADLCPLSWPLEGVERVGDSIILGCYGGSRLSRIDVASNSLAGTYDIGLNGGTAVAAAGSWWSPIGTDEEPALARIDATTGAIQEVRDLGRNNGPEGMAIAGDALWIATEPNDSVLRVPLDELRTP